MECAKIALLWVCFLQKFILKSLSLPKVFISMFKSFLILLICFALFACNNEYSPSPLNKIWYSVQVPNNDFKLEITYYSDLYYASNTLDTLTVQQNNPNINQKFWKSIRIPEEQRDESYFIHIQAQELPDTLLNYSIYVFANDSVLLDSSAYHYNEREKTLSGNIPKFFN